MIARAGSGRRPRYRRIVQPVVAWATQPAALLDDQATLGRGHPAPEMDHLALSEHASGADHRHRMDVAELEIAGRISDARFEHRGGGSAPVATSRR
jgi:hypothetical protein